MERTTVPAILALPAEVSNDRLSALDAEAVRVIGPDATALVVDLSQTTFMSSGGFGLLVKWGKKVADRGGRVALLRPQPPVARLLRSIGLDEILPVFRDADAASSFAAGGPAR